MTRTSSAIRRVSYHRPHVRGRCSLWLLAPWLLLATILPAVAQVAWDFEQEADLQLWSVNAAGSTFELVREAGEFHQGEAAAKLTFNASAGHYFALQAADLSAPGAVSLRFAVRASAPTPLRLLLAERDGSEYDGFYHLPAETWVEVQSPLAELQLAEGAEDENDVLDPEQIASVTLADLSNVGGTAAATYGRKTGTQYLWLDAFRLDQQKCPGRYRVERRRTVVDALIGPLIPWLALGRPVLTARQDIPEAHGGDALQIQYHLGGYQWQGLVTGMAARPLAGLTQVTLRVGGTNAGLRVRLEEHDGSKYDAHIDVRRDETWQDVSIPLAQFERAKYSSDEDDRLNPEQIRVIIIQVDARDALVDQDGNGAFYLDDIELSFE